jgi:hypothetical protein
MRMTKTRKWRMYGTYFQLNATSFQRQHLGIAKRLRDHWISRVEVSKAHRYRQLRAAEKNGNLAKASAQPIAIKNAILLKIQHLNGNTLH